MVPDIDAITVGKRICQKRKELKLTQTNIKESIGISSGNMSEIENGKILPSASNLLRLSDLFNCSMECILTGNSSNHENSNFITSRESDLVEGFRKLSECEKNELLEILNLKLRKEKERSLSSNLKNEKLA